MAWTAPATVVAGQIMTAAFWNTHVRDNEGELRAGGLALASQAALDFVYASSSSQLSRLAKGTGLQYLRVNSGATAYEFATIDLSTVWPVGSIYMNAGVSTNPATLLGFGTWAAWGVGRVPVSLDVGQTEFDTLEETGGFKTHTLTIAELAVHTHIQNSHSHSTKDQGIVDPGGGSFIVAKQTGGGTDSDTVIATTPTNQNTGSGSAHNNLQPYITCYMWKRTA